jgi:hypothetical protein
MEVMSVIFPFNNSIETGLRTLCLLNAFFPRSFDLETLSCLDYMCVHTGDFDESMQSLHPENPYRTGELYVRRNIIEEGVALFISKGLIEVLYDSSGIEYIASDDAASFLDTISSSYSLGLIERAQWISEQLQDRNNDDIQAMIKKIAKDYAFQMLKL